LDYIAQRVKDLEAARKRGELNIGDQAERRLIGSHVRVWTRAEYDQATPEERMEHFRNRGTVVDK
jgi:hypothetical protein